LSFGARSESYLATGLEPGTDYRFKVEARTEYGYGSESEILVLTTASEITPDDPLSPIEPPPPKEPPENNFAMTLA
jgi:hypothetical protein